VCQSVSEWGELGTMNLHDPVRDFGNVHRLTYTTAHSLLYQRSTCLVCTKAKAARAETGSDSAFAEPTVTGVRCEVDNDG
jgi:hypothetical protein